MGNHLLIRMASAALTDASFDKDVLQCHQPVLVDFWAPWCGPCRMIAPVVEEIANIYAGKIKVFKMNIDENPNVASKYAVRSIPTLILFKAGGKVDLLVGAVRTDALRAMVEKHI